MKVKSFNHYTIEVKDLEVAIQFYTEILGLSILKRPNFDFGGGWLAMGNQQSIHLVHNPDRVVQVPSGSRQLHFAFEVDDIYGYKAFLISQNIDIVKDIKARPDGILQLYITDPDGYYIELTQIDNI